MTTVILLGTESLVGPGLRWPIRIAALAGGEAIFIVPGAARSQTGEVEVDFDSAADQPSRAAELAEKLRGLLVTNLGEAGWAAGGPSPKPTANEEPAPLAVRARIVPAGECVAAALRLLADARSDQLVFVTEAYESEDSDFARTSESLIRGTDCALAYVVPGQREGDGELLATAQRGPHAARALRLAADLAEREQRPLSAVYVEANIGADARNVGARMLDRVLTNVLGERAASVQRRVEVADRPVEGIVAAAEDDRFEVLVMGASRLAALGSRTRSVAYHVVRATDEPTRIQVRGAVPRVRRLQRWTDFQLERFVPQLERSDRADLAARVQASSEWNFDFASLMGLSTVIAAMGLIGDSGAVIIGAMLVAPLMTPLLGLGLALAQGNPRLTRMSLRAALFSFLLAFGLAVGVGLLSPEFVEATPQMRGRNWPQMRDLIVAFAGGLAASYASGRPGLLAALPGVAIAAALLPPIATSGLALSIRNYDLAAGAVLLFLVNMVAIIVAAVISLWAVGVRSTRGHTPINRVVGALLSTAAVGIAVALALAPARLAPPAALLQEVEERLGDRQRLRLVLLSNEAPGRIVQINLGGSRAPDDELRRDLLEIAERHVDDVAGLRLTFRFEVVEWAETDAEERQVRSGQRRFPLGRSR